MHIHGGIARLSSDLYSSCVGCSSEKITGNSIIAALVYICQNYYCYFGYLLIKQVYDSLFLLLSKRSRLTAAFFQVCVILHARTTVKIKVPHFPPFCGL